MVIFSFLSINGNHHRPLLGGEFWLRFQWEVIMLWYRNPRSCTARTYIGISPLCRYKKRHFPVLPNSLYFSSESPCCSIPPSFLKWFTYCWISSLRNYVCNVCRWTLSNLQSINPWSFLSFMALNATFNTFNNISVIAWQSWSS